LPSVGRPVRRVSQERQHHDLASQLRDLSSIIATAMSVVKQTESRRAEHMSDRVGRKRLRRVQNGPVVTAQVWHSEFAVQ